MGDQQLQESTEASVFDREALMEKFSGLENLVRESVLVFQTHLEKMLAAIDEAHARGAAQDLKIAAHTLKGAVSNFYAQPTRALAEKLERIGASGDLRLAAETIAALKAELTRLVEALTAAFLSDPGQRGA